MKTYIFCYILAFLSFQTVILAAVLSPGTGIGDSPAEGPSFDANLCPQYHLEEVGDNASIAINLVATCSDSSNRTQYRTSSLNLDQCLYNEEGYLFGSEPHDFYTGPFSKSCSNCGLSYLSIDREDKGIYIKCTCLVSLGDDRTPRQSIYRLGRIVYVKNYTLGCFEFVGQPIDDSPLYPNSAPPADSVATVTATSTIYANVTVTQPSSPTSSPGNFTIPSTVTITETKWKTRKPVVMTETQTAYSPVTILVSIPVTVTPTLTPRISAVLYTTVQASFVTVNSSTDGV
ncbi:hypothetical protein F5B19DRAFT_435778 [Rostrohypoxylon terebratum]|nr:hypothetical protein F5B19DRAFT_435778 [Rostrohypoxylon terebratum]